MPIISLIGMSGTGKTYWSNQLVQHDWEKISCDDLIERRLAKNMSPEHEGIQGVAEWLGLPQSEGYQERQQQYLRAEIDVMEEVLERLNKCDSNDCRIVLDTTGSVVYTGDRLCQQLRQAAKVIYFSLSDISLSSLIHQFLTDPKPVLWIDQFVQYPHQTIREAIAACYPKLVRQRAQLYQRYAEMILPYEQIHQPDFTVEDFLHAID